MRLIINTLIVASATVSAFLFGFFIDMYWLINPEKARELFIKVLEWTKQ